MRNTSLLLIILISLISCGKKKRVLEYGSITLEDGSVLRNELYIDHDSAFEEFRDAAGRLCIMKKSATEKDFRDSTYSTVFYYENGNVMATQSCYKKSPVGSMIKYYQSGKKDSESKFENGKLLELTIWWETGKVNVELKYLADGKIIRNEFFENGNPSQQLEVDSLWSGKCVNFYENGKKKGEGNVFHKNPSGFWKLYDSLGNPSRDTLFLAEGPLKTK